VWDTLSLFIHVLLTLSFAVFREAPVFNQDVSKWNTSAVIDMDYSKFIIVCPPLATLFIIHVLVHIYSMYVLCTCMYMYMYTYMYCVFEYIIQLEFHLITILTRSVALILLHML